MTKNFALTWSVRQKRGKTKGWGAIIHETLEKEKGPVAQTILKVAIKVASSFL